MKRNYIAFFVLLGTLVCSGGCVDDKGNYDYMTPEQVMPVEIVSGVEDAVYPVLSTVEIKPELKNMENEEDYDFLWYAYEGSRSDTLCRTRDASFVATFPINVPYKLVYTVTNKKTGVFTRAEATIRTVSEISQGWFLLKDIDNETDLDIVLPTGKIVENVISETLGKRMEGKARKITYIGQYYYETATGGWGTDKQAYHILSEGDMNTFDAADFSLLKNYEQEFYFPPANKEPQDIQVGYRVYMGRTQTVYTFLLNGGAVNTISGMTMHYSQFDYEKSGPRTLYPAMIAHTYGGFAAALVYDMSGEGAFYFADMSGVALTPIPEAEGKNPTNREMIWMQQTHDYSSNMPFNTSGWAILKTRDAQPKYELAQIDVYGNYLNPFTQIGEIGAGRKLITADVREPMQGGGTIYFAKGGVLYYYQKTGPDETSTEKEIYTFSGETVTHISNLQDAPGTLVVCTEAGGKWKMYIFKTKSPVPDLDTAVPPTVYTGNGTVRFVINRP